MRAQSAGVACRVCCSVAYSTGTAPRPTRPRQEWEWPTPRCVAQSKALLDWSSLQDLPCSGCPQTRTYRRGQRWRKQQSHRRHFPFRFCSDLHLNNDSSLIKDLNDIVLSSWKKYTCMFALEEYWIIYVNVLIIIVKIFS